MDETSLETTFTCQPQQRNIHGRVFGGFLMRRAYELAHSTAYLFAGRRPHAGALACWMSGSVGQCPPLCVPACPLPACPSTLLPAVEVEKATLR